MEKEITIDDLVRITPDELRSFKPYMVVSFPVPDTFPIPESIKQYNPAIWRQHGIWHTLLGSLPEKCIWTLGTTIEESMQEFDKELKAALQADGTIKFLSEEERKNLHKEVGNKIDKIIQKT